tara:strand:+ start:392 stop:595 length:204 start_codon:yes stop_codon:yes gene_type:complete
MDKLSEMLLASLAVVGAWTTKRIFKNTDTLSDRVSALELIVLKKEDLHSLERNIDIILTHILNKKNK